MKLEIEMSVTIRMDSGISLVLTEAEAREAWKLLDEHFRNLGKPKPGSFVEIGAASADAIYQQPWRGNGYFP